MHPQLDAIVAEFERASSRLHGLVQNTPTASLSARPGAGRWSAAECVAHLNLTTIAFRPLVERALDEARRSAGAGPAMVAPGRYRRGLVGGLLWWVLGRRGAFRTKTTAAFVPGATDTVEDLVAAFDRLQDEQIGWVRAADGLAIDAVKVPSPFDARVRYNLFAALSILPRHQHRHLAQAEEAVGESSAP